jgi:hypothetical protein
VRSEMKEMIIQYLRTHLRLKLKVNFEKCIFRVEEYVQRILERGGIIEEYVEDCDTFEFCYKIEPGYSECSNLHILDDLEDEKYIAVCQNYEVDYVGKLAVFGFTHSELPQSLRGFSKKVDKILKN